MGETKRKKKKEDVNTIIDTDALLGLSNINDVHHGRATTLLRKLRDEDATIFLLHTTLGEFALLASSRIGVKETKNALKRLTNGGFVFIDINESLTKEAVLLYQNQTSKEESLFDCYIMVAAKKIAADAIFSFDKGYEKNTFTLVSSLLSSN